MIVYGKINHEDYLQDGYVTFYSMCSFIFMFFS